MRYKFSILDYSLILLGLLSLYLGVETMLDTPTLILPGWFLVIMYGGVLLLVAVFLGNLISSLTKSKLKPITSASIIVTLVCASFYVSEYRPTYKIDVPANFTGGVKLFRSTLNNNILSLNQLGVGYITDKAYRKGFRPVIYRNGKNITKQCRNLGQGSVGFASVDGTSVGPFPYVGFIVGDNAGDSIWTDLKTAIAQKIIDTSIIRR